GDLLGTVSHTATQLVGELVQKHPEQAGNVTIPLIASVRQMGNLEVRAPLAGVLGTIAEHHAELRPQIATALTGLIKAGEPAAITPLGKCGRDARDALPILKPLQVHHLEAVRTAASAAVKQIEDALGPGGGRAPGGGGGC